ncbi:MAG: sigma-70 family RNA polymerase sigma factor [Gemmatimonas sp.]
MATAVNGDDNLSATLTEQIPYLRRYARGLTHNVADADDLVQSCLLRALTNMHRFEKNTNLRAWLLTILHNIFIDTVRKRRRARETFEAAGIASDGLSQSANQFHRVQVTELEQAVAQLPPEQRSTLLLVALEDLTYEEAARVTGVPVGTVRSRLSRARQMLLNVVEGVSIDDVERDPELGRARRALKRRAAAARQAEERRRMVA